MTLYQHHAWSRTCGQHTRRSYHNKDTRWAPWLCCFSIHHLKVKFDSYVTVLAWRWCCWRTYMRCSGTKGSFQSVLADSGMDPVSTVRLGKLCCKGLSCSLFITLFHDEEELVHTWELVTCWTLVVTSSAVSRKKWQLNFDFSWCEAGLRPKNCSLSCVHKPGLFLRVLVLKVVLV